VSPLESKITALESKITTLEQKIAGIEGRFDEVQRKPTVSPVASPAPVEPQNNLVPTEKETKQQNLQHWKRNQNLLPPQNPVPRSTNNITLLRKERLSAG
jgi:hypothetical protein